MSITKDNYKQAIHSCLKPIIIVIILSILRGFANILPGSSQRLGDFFLGDFVVMGIIVAVSYYVFKIYKPVKTILSYWIVNVFKSSKLGETSENKERLILVADKVNLAIYLLFTYYYLIPFVKGATSYFIGFDYDTLSTLFDVVMVLAVLFIIISLWRISLPLIDHLSGSLSERVTKATDSIDFGDDKSVQDKENIYCPSCNKINQLGTKFCIFCGTSISRLASESTKKPGICPNCNTQNSPSAKYCNECGSNIKQIGLET